MHKRTLEAKLKYEGLLFDTDRFGKIEVLDFKSGQNVVVKFITTGSIVTSTMHNIRRGLVRDMHQPSYLNVGIVDTLAKVGGKELKEYTIWTGMLSRCYSTAYHNKRPSYTGCFVSENFKKLSSFSEWCGKQTGFGNKGWHLDKDILVKGNKIYSEATCCFVPLAINSLILNSKGSRGTCPVGVSYDISRDKYVASMTVDNRNTFLGRYDTVTKAFEAYKVNKEAHIKDVANKWKDQIDPRVYAAMMNWEVNIDD